MKDSILILTGGGPAPGINTVIGTIAKCFIAHGYRVLGLHGGYKGLFGGEPNFEEIDFFLKQTAETGEQEINFKFNGDLCSAHAMLLSSKHGRKAMLLSVNNITQRMNINHEQLIDQSLMNIYSMYLRVSILRPEKDELVTVFSQDHHDIPTDTVLGMRNLTEHYAEIGVFKEDRSKYLDFLNGGIEQRIQDSERGFINTKIRTQDADGSYTKKMYLAVNSGNHEVILLVRYANL